MPDEPTEDYTVEELARAAGTMTTTVRLYQARGLLHPPAKRGRVAVYGPSHLHRLELIAELQQRGHSLAGIKELLENADRGVALVDLLGLPSWGPPAPIRLSPAEFVGRIGGTVVSADEMRRAVQLGLVRLDGDVLEVDERFLHVGSELVALGVPISAILDEWQALRRGTAAIADRFAKVFATHLLPRMSKRRAGLADVTAVLDQLAPLAQQVTALALEQALRTTAEDFARDYSK